MKRKLIIVSICIVIVLSLSFVGYKKYRIFVAPNEIKLESFYKRD